MIPESGRAGTNPLTGRHASMARIRRLRALIVGLSIAGTVMAIASGCAVVPAYVAPARVVVAPRPVVVAPAPVVWGVIRVR